MDATPKLAAEDSHKPCSLLEEKVPRWAVEHRLEEKKSLLTNGFDIFESPPPKTENEVKESEGLPRAAGGSWEGISTVFSQRTGSEHLLCGTAVNIHTGGREPFVKHSLA